MCTRMISNTRCANQHYVTKRFQISSLLQHSLRSVCYSLRTLHILYSVRIFTRLINFAHRLFIEKPLVIFRRDKNRICHLLKPSVCAYLVLISLLPLSSIGHSRLSYTHLCSLKMSLYLFFIAVPT